ncbi:hypothetical protein DSM112329_02950 [Paraconexibacter sp. AEG42_29]|uniref:Uncharacterized protein n=1 Tax=Paraconexibacter sp. AEG42_29 TaxID=2997339 RepID=A0AAU7AWS6_9ACTN
MPRLLLRRAAGLLGALAPLACIVAAPALGAAPPTLRASTLGPVSGAVLADGERWAAWQPDASTTRILDGRTGTLTDVAVPDACLARAGAPFDAGAGRGLTAIGGGQLAWTCGTTGTVTTYPTLLDLRTMTVRLPAGLPTLLPSPASFYLPPCPGAWTGLGTRWVRASCPGEKSEYPLDLDARRGIVAQTAPILGRRTVDSLDTISRTRTLCAPVLASRRQTQSGVRGFTQRSPQEASGWVIGTTPRRGPLVVQRCGTRRVLTLSACRPSCSVGTLTGGWIAWSTSGPSGVTRARQVGTRALGRTLVLRPTASAAPVAAGRVVLTDAGPFTRRVVRVWRLPGAPRLPEVPAS